MQDADRRRFWTYSLLGLILLGLTQKASGADRIIERIEALRAGDPVMVLGAPLHSREALVEFYQGRNYEPAWESAGAREELLAAIRDAASDGLIPADYHYGSLSEHALGEALPESPEIRTDVDLLLSDAFLLLASHLRHGKLDPESRAPRWQSFDEHNDTLAELHTALLYNQVHARLERQKPSAPEYRKLVQLRKRISDLSGELWLPIGPGPAIRPGDADPRLPEIRRRLQLLGDLPEPSGGTPEPGTDHYNDALLQAIPEFQARHGLEPDGVIGAKTLTELNRLPLERLQAIDANLERWRWLPDSLGGTYVLVNIAGFELHLVENGRETLHQRVIVGGPYRQTPVFSDRIRYLVFNPTWTVPRRLMVEDQLPLIQNDPAYLDRMGFKVYQGWGADRIEVDPATIDWHALSRNNFPYQLVQQPGPRNAVGQVKFMFPNQYDVYLHDTPGQNLFRRSDRQLSSGCIRVERPFELAQKLLQNNRNWGPSALDEALGQTSPVNVVLDTPVPVHLLYWTVWVDQAGRYQFRDDIYGRDRQLTHALRADWQGNLQLTPRSEG
ncbi:MAG TPA: L,D-transpeptidase family protein [Marinobacter sp.]|nr:L,D-transpeptidase family protein [Marinobacter sp.]